MAYKPPTRREIYDAFHPDRDSADQIEQFNRSLNIEPHEGWIKTHTGTKNKYLPIECVEFLLTYFFQIWKREIIRVEIMANSVVAIVRVHVKHPITGEWYYHDGIGAVPIQLAAGSKPHELQNINTMALQLNTPAAVSFAVSNAAGQFGKIFGRDILRKQGGVDYVTLLNLADEPVPVIEDEHKAVAKEQIENELKGDGTFKLDFVPLKKQSRKIEL